MFSMAEIEYQTNTIHTWDNNKYIPDVVIIALGANDNSILSQYADDSKEYSDFVASFEQSYYDFIDQIYKAYPDTLVVVSDEILELNKAFTDVADIVTENYKSQGKKIVRATYEARNLSKDRNMPGAGHPNAEMHKIAGYELARIIADELNITINEGNFWQNYKN
jgi:lysophospholipase L1-like esterase